ncbi:lysosome membrane protein 2-like [Glandiceps talaboti]
MVHAAIKFGIPLTIGVAVVAVGISLFWVLDNVLHNMVNQQMTLSPDSQLYDTWQHPDMPVHMQFYVFSIVNAEEVKNGEKKPYVIQKGPYTYKESRVKEVISWNNKENTVTYRENITYVFDREMSVGWDNETFTTLSIPLLTLVNLVKYEPDLVQYVIEALEKQAHSSLFMDLSVKDLVWGYKDPLLAYIKSLPLIGDLLPIPEEFGLFMGRNGSSDGVYTIYTNPENLALIKEWKGSPNLTWWTDPYANMINGTDGSLAPPFFSTDQPAYIYSSDICRSVYGLYEKDVDVKGITLKRYTTPPILLGNVTFNPNNVGYCTPNANYCLPGGLLNASNCQQGAPVVYSLPHFLYADKEVMLPCLNPNKEEHQTLIDTDYITGVSMRVYKRLQINVHLQRHEDIEDLSHLNDIFYPVLWINESYVIDDASANKYKSEVAMPVKVLKIIPWLVVGIGLLIVIITVILMARRGYKSKSSGYSIQDGSQPPLLNETT